MDKALEKFKLLSTGIVSGVAYMFGGYDKVLSLLVWMIIADLLTGLIHAVMRKTVSSSAMRDGILRKGLIFLVIFLAYRLDLCVIEMNGGVLEIGGVALSIRTLFIAYFCVEEGISLVENLSNIGVPMPGWLKEVLLQVSECANKSSPKHITNALKKLFKAKLGISDIEDLTDAEDHGDKKDENLSEDGSGEGNKE